MNTLYHDRMLEYYRNPRNRGNFPAPNFSSGMVNPSCGDAVQMHGILDNNKIAECRFEGKGCVISQATASMLCERVMGTSRDAIEAIDAAQMIEMIGMRLGPTRLKCALLPLQALKKAVREMAA